MRTKKNTSSLTSIFIFLVLAFWGCHSNNGKDKLQKPQFLTIDFSDILKGKKVVPVSEIAESVVYIPLEKTAKSLVGSILDAYLTKKYILIHHNGSPLLAQFSRDGKFWFIHLPETM